MTVAAAASKAVAGEEPGALAVQMHEVAQQRRRLELEPLGLLAGRVGKHPREQLGEVDRVLRPGRAEQHRDVGMRDHVAQLVLLEAAVDRHRDGAELGRSEKAGDEVELVRHQDPDLVAGADTEPAQRPRDAVGQRRELGKRDPLVGEDDRIPARLRCRPSTRSPTVVASMKVRGTA